MRYSLFCGGKRLRPILALAGAEAVGGDPYHALPLACAVECIHTFSLIHDDLPAIDDDDLRRGSPTNHVVYGEAMAILAGDALLALAFELIAECRLYLPADRVLDALAMVARASGTRGMVGGQVSDIECEGRDDLDEPTVASIHARKTGALLLASLLAGARLCGASVAEETPCANTAVRSAWPSRSPTTFWTWKATRTNSASRSAAISSRTRRPTPKCWASPPHAVSPAVPPSRRRRPVRLQPPRRPPPRPGRLRRGA